MKRYFAYPLLALTACLGSPAFSQTNPYTQRFIDLRNKIYDPANGYFSRDGVPYHSPETLICEAPDYGHETTSEAYSYWIWLEVMNGRVTGDWTPLNNAWSKMEAFAIPTPDLQPTNNAYNPNAPATYAGEWELPDSYPSLLDSSVAVGRDPVSAELTAAYGPNIYGMHWLFDCDNFYGYGKKGDGTSTPSYINTFQRGEQESVWETVPHPSWESFRWGSNDGTGFLKLFTKEAGAPAAQWRYTNAPDADARAVQAIYWGVQFAKEQGLNPATVLPVSKASKMGDFGRLAMFDKYFRTIGTQSRTGPGGTGYSSAHYLMSWYYAWGGPLVPQGWAWRIGSSHNHFGYQNPVVAYALSATTELRPVSANGARDWGQSLTRQLEFYRWLQSAEGAIAGGATNSWNGRYDPYPAGTPTFYGMAYQENPVYHDPGSNTWFGFQAWSMERVAEYYYITNDERARLVLEKWIPWAKSVVVLSSDGSFEIPSEIGWSGAPATWNPASPAANTNLHVRVVANGQDVGIAAALAKTFTYWAAATQKYSTLDTGARDLAQQILDRMWTKFYQPTGKGITVVEKRSDFHRFFDQTVFIPAGWSGKMANGDVIAPGVKFIDIRSQYRRDPDYPALLQSFADAVPFEKAYHRFWAQVDIALANAEFGRFFGGPVVNTPVTGVAVTPLSASVNVGGSTTLTATVSPATASNKAVTWSSSDTSIATVSPTGVVTGVAAGSAIVTVRTTDGGFTATSSVLVSNATIPVTGVTVTPTTASVAVGSTTALTATVAPANAANKTVTWTSSNTAIATVNASGVVTGVAAGSATVTARTQDGGFTATSAITVTSTTIPATGVSVTPTTVSVGIGATTTLTATVAPTNASNKAVTWSSSNPAVATVSASGVVTGVSAGTATVTVTTQSGSFTASSLVTVTSTNTPPPPPPPGPCENASAITLNFTQNGAGEFCFVTSGNISYLNSWNTQLVEINGVVITNRWSNAMPARINGNYYIRYVGTVPWAHLEITGTNSGPAPSVPTTGVSITPTTVSVGIGATTTLTATVAPTNASNKAVTWSSSNPAVATVSASGVVTGVSAGTATITVTTQSGSFTASSLVTVTSTNTPPPPPPPGPCENASAITLNFTQNGAGEFCFVTSGNISYLNSWNTQLVEINGVVITNRWSNAMPARINGNYYIRYVGTVPWAHLEITGSN